MFGLNNFGFVAVWSPYLMLFIIAVGVAYWLVTGRWRAKFKHSEPVSFRQKFAFMSGLFLYYMAQGGPLDLLGHLMFSAHMVAMALAFLAAPPLILMGIPGWLIRPLFRIRPIRALSRVFLHPILTVVLFNMLFSFYHIPEINDVILTNYALHTIYYFILLVTAFMMWWPMVCPIKEMDTMSDVKKMGYIFVNGVLLTPACALIIFAGEPMYAAFNDPAAWAKALGYCVPAGSSIILSNFQGPGFFAIMPPIEDQQLGGVAMKLLQETIYGSILAYTFYNWYRRENPRNEIDPIPPEMQEYALASGGSNRLNEA